MNFKGFKSGTDIRGYGAEQFSDEPLYLSDEFVMAVAESFANWLGARTGKYTNEITVSIGRDSRVSGPRIMAAAITVGLYRLPMSFCMMSTGRRPPCSEPTTGLKSA